MSVRFALAAPAAAHASVQSVAADAYTLTAGRLVGTVAALVALAGVIIGGSALARSTGRPGHGNGKGKGKGRRGAVVALAAGLTGVVIGTLNLAVADGGPGTGNGVVGGASALVLGVIGTVLGGLALARFRRTGGPAQRLTG
jgi:hypothetical protein